MNCWSKITVSTSLAEINYVFRMQLDLIKFFLVSLWLSKDDFEKISSRFPYVSSLPTINTVFFSALPAVFSPYRKLPAHIEMGLCIDINFTFFCLKLIQGMFPTTLVHEKPLRVETWLLVIFISLFEREAEGLCSFEIMVHWVDFDTRFTMNQQFIVATSLN